MPTNKLVTKYCVRLVCSFMRIIEFNYIMEAQHIPNIRKKKVHEYNFSNLDRKAQLRQLTRQIVFDN